MNRVFGLAWRVAGFMLAGMVISRTGLIGALGGIGASWAFRSKTRGVAKGMLSGAAMAGGVVAMHALLDAVDRSDVLGRYEGQVIGSARRGLLGVR